MKTLKEHRKTLVIIVLLAIVYCSAFAQQTTQAFEKMSLSLGISTLGPRLEVATSINNYFDLRGGLSILPLNNKTEFSISAEKYRKYIDYDPNLNVDSKLSFAYAHILTDIRPVENSKFFFTTGFFIGSSTLNADGILVNPKNQRPTVYDLQEAGYIDDKLPEFIFEDDYVIQPYNDGSVKAKLKLGNVIKPYLGLGFGSNIRKNGFGVKFDLGIIYQGKPNLSSPNLIKGDLNDYIDTSEDLKPYKAWLSWYPMISLQLVYRIK